MKLTIASHKAVEYACLKFHYAKTVPIKLIAFNVYNDNNEWCGVIVYGSGANAQISQPYDKWQGQVIELVRVALNGKQECTSKAVALSLKLLHKYCPMVDLVVSYADMDQEHYGTIYQATNFIYTGETTVGKKVAFIVNGKRMHNRSIQGKGWKANLLWLRENIDKQAKEFITKGKRKYLYSFDKKLSKRIELLKEEYPKLTNKKNMV